jgi:zinc protease
MPGPGPFLISLSTQNKQAKEAIELTQDTLKRFVADGPSQQELDAAQSYLTGSFPMSLSSNRTIASLLLRMTFYHLPEQYLNTYLDRVKAVTIQDIKRAFQKEVHPDQLILITVGQS